MPIKVGVPFRLDIPFKVDIPIQVGVPIRLDILIKVDIPIKVDVSIPIKVHGLADFQPLSNLFYFPSEKGSSLKGKNLLPLGANSFLLEQIPFEKGVQERKQEVTKTLSLVKKKGGNSTVCIRSL